MISPSPPGACDGAPSARASGGALSAAGGFDTGAFTGGFDAGAFAAGAFAAGAFAAGVFAGAAFAAGFVPFGAGFALAATAFADPLVPFAFVMDLSEPV